MRLSLADVFARVSNYDLFKSFLTIMPCSSNLTEAFIKVRGEFEWLLFPSFYFKLNSYLS